MHVYELVKMNLKKVNNLTGLIWHRVQSDTYFQNNGYIIYIYVYIIFLILLKILLRYMYTLKIL